MTEDSESGMMQSMVTITHNVTRLPFRMTVDFLPEACFYKALVNLFTLFRRRATEDMCPEMLAAGGHQNLLCIKQRVEAAALRRAVQFSSSARTLRRAHGIRDDRIPDPPCEERSATTAIRRTGLERKKQTPSQTKFIPGFIIKRKLRSKKLFHHCFLIKYAKK